MVCRAKRDMATQALLSNPSFETHPLWLAIRNVWKRTPHRYGVLWANKPQPLHLGGHLFAKNVVTCPLACGELVSLWTLESWQC